jgi:predicted amidohydrolase
MGGAAKCAYSMASQHHAYLKVPLMTIRLAVVQQAGNPGRPEENLAKALKSAAEALRQGAEIILFHEELTLGYVPNARDLAEPLAGPTSQAFQRLLQGREARIIYGLTERDGDTCYIAAPVISADGVLANYRKTHLWWASQGLRHEPAFYQPGDRLVTFEFKGQRIGLMICYDGDFPEMTRAYANRGCSIVLWLNNRGSRGHEEVTDLAYRNSMIIAAACCCGVNEQGDACRGGSNITAADGSLLAEIWDREGLIMAEVDPASALARRATNPWYRGQRPDLYH